MDAAAAKNLIDRIWDAEVVPELTSYIRIPNKSPSYDPDWRARGHMDAAVEQFAGWARSKLAELPGAQLEVVRLEDRTPLIFIEVPGDAADTVLLYGHLDKQPEMAGWAEGMGPWTPVLKDGRLYGRGGADDGYAMFGALAALLALHAQGAPHARAVVMIEACEESGSYDLPAYVERLAGRIGSPSLVVCLDSGCANYEQLWLTTSLRGLALGFLRVEVLKEGVHSGAASGIVPSSFRILRTLLSRLEDEATGEILLPELHAQIPPDRIEEARAAGAAMKADVWESLPFCEGMRPVSDDPAELILNRTWRPALSVVGLEGAPPLRNAGNVLRPWTAASLSMRLPPTVDPDRAAAAMTRALLTDPPYGAKISFDLEHGGVGWNAPPMAAWLEASVDRASMAAFGRPAAMMGEGGAIPFMGMLGEKFPQAQFVITGVLGPGSNAHGPNEFLDIAMGKGVTLAIAQILADHARRNQPA